MKAPLNPLSLRSTLLVVLVSIFGLELGVRQLYSPPTPMLDKAIAFEAQAHSKDQLLIFGTCLPEQIISPELLQQQLGGDLQVQNLATAAGTSRLMYLTLKNYISESTPVRGIIVPYGTTDLTKRMDPYESQAMEIARLEDLSDLIAIECVDADCRTQMWMRKLSKAYRYRGYLANWFWQSIGSKPPVPGYAASPGAVEERPGDKPPPMSSQRRPDRPVDRLGDGAIEPDRSGPGRYLGPERMTVVKSDFRYLIAFLDLAKEREIPIFLVPLPLRSSYLPEGDGGHNDAYRERLAKVIQEHGGIQLEADEIPGLTAEDFTDDVHLEKRGRGLVTRALGLAVNEELKRQ